MVVGQKNQCREAVHNFKSSGTRQYQVVSVTFDNYFENIKENIDDIYVFISGMQSKEDYKRLDV